MTEHRHTFTKSGARVDTAIRHDHVAKVLIARRALARDGRMLPDWRG